MKRSHGSRSFALFAGLVLAAGLPACATGQSPTGAGGGSTTSGSTTTTSATNTHVACSPGMPCDPGQTCSAGICAAGCNADKDCGEDQYCGLQSGQVCLDKTLVACPETPCSPTQVCVQGLCGTIPTGTPCGPSPFGGSDGCDMLSLCLSNVEVDGVLKTDPTCYVTPPCDPDHPCSPGGAGALCSAGLLQNKKGSCIPGGCATAENCPASWKCVQGPPMAGYGLCTDGAAGHPCGKQEDCQSGLQCKIPIQNQPGTCK